MAVRMFAGLLASPRRSLVLLTACTALGGAGTTTLTGCQSLAPIVDVAVRACIQLISELLNAPLSQLPPGYVPCGGPIDWPIHDAVMTVCFYCNKNDPNTVYLQSECQGPYYPMRIRPGEHTVEGEDRLPGPTKLNCKDRMLLTAQSTYDAWRNRVSMSLKAPNARLLPTPGRYETIEVKVNGVPVMAKREFAVDFGASIEVSGSIDEVAHYAMHAGVESIVFLDGGKKYEVFVNPDISAMMVFRDGVCVDKRFVFAPSGE
jgi:hypothetical protein